MKKVFSVVRRAPSAVIKFFAKVLGLPKLYQVWKDAEHDHGWTWAGHAFVTVMVPCIIVGLISGLSNISHTETIAAYLLAITVAALFYARREFLDEKAYRRRWFCPQTGETVPPSEIRTSGKTVWHLHDDGENCQVLSAYYTAQALLTAAVDKTGDSLGPYTAWATAVTMALLLWQPWVAIAGACVSFAFIVKAMFASAAKVRRERRQ